MWILTNNAKLGVKDVGKVAYLLLYDSLTVVTDASRRIITRNKYLFIYSTNLLLYSVES